MTGIDLVDAARGEVEDLHEFFVAWFTGTADDTGQVFERFADALHPEFSMITPSGEVLDRDEIVASVRAAHGSGGSSFAIEIRSTVVPASSEDVAVVSYEEWQFVGERVVSRRASTAVFLRSAEAANGVQWRHLHETFRPV